MLVTPWRGNWDIAIWIKTTKTSWTTRRLYAQKWPSIRNVANVIKNKVIFLRIRKFYRKSCTNASFQDKYNGKYSCFKISVSWLSISRHSLWGFFYHKRLNKSKIRIPFFTILRWTTVSACSSFMPCAAFQMCIYFFFFFFFFFSLNDNFIEPWNYTRSTEDLRHVVRWHYIQRDPSYYNI